MSKTRPGGAHTDFREIFDRELAYVMGTLRRLGIRPHDLEDLAQEVFVDLYSHLDKFDPSRPFRPWLFTFAFHVASNYRRLARHRREVTGVEAELVPSSGQSPEDQAARTEARDLITRALDRMDLDRRAVFVMHDIDGFSAPEIARSLDVPVNTVYSRLRLAREGFEKAVRIEERSGARP